MLGAIALVAPASGFKPAGGSPTASHAPSFRCEADLSQTEQLICSDAELSAYDRGVAYAFSRSWRLLEGRVASNQRDWLRRRDRCGTRRDCVLQAYKDWVQDSTGASLGTELRRVAGSSDDSGDYFLETFQSPPGEVTQLSDSGQLSMKALGDDWYFFAARALYIYDPHDGRGSNVSDSGAQGLVYLTNGRGTFVDEYSCALKITKLPKGAWKLVEQGGCSGVGSSLTGIYAK